MNFARLIIFTLFSLPMLASHVTSSPLRENQNACAQQFWQCIRRVEFVDPRRDPWGLNSVKDRENLCQADYNDCQRLVARILLRVRAVGG